MIHIIFFTPYGNKCIHYVSPHLSLNLSESHRIGQEVTRKRFYPAETKLSKLAVTLPLIPHDAFNPQLFANRKRMEKKRFSWF